MTSLFTQECGSGVPVLVIPGWEMSGAVEAADFEPIFTKTTGFRRIYVDLPGHGKTPAHGIQNLDDILSYLTKFIDARLGNERFLVVGSSCGALFARTVALKYREQIDGLLLRVPLIEPENSKRDLDLFTPLVRDEEVMSSISTEDKAQLGDVLIQTPAYVKTLTAKYKEFYLPAVEASDKEVLGVIRDDTKRYRLSLDLDKTDQRKLLAPTLIVCGRQDGVVGYRDSLRLLELYPRSTFAVLDRGGHDLPVDEQDVFEALVLDWLKRVNEWGIGKDN